MYGVMIVLFLLVCIGLVISILLQSAKGEGLAGAFGGSSLTGTVFGGRGAATFLSRATTYLGAAFMLLALTLSLMHPTTGSSSATGSSAVQEAASQAPAPPPATTTDPSQTPGQQPQGQDNAATTDDGSAADELFNDNQQQQTQPAEQAQPGDTNK